jgi:hypothetical protein
MKNTLLAVLIMALCYDRTQAQSISPPIPDYIKYQGTNSNKSVDKRAVPGNTQTDGVATTDKLADDIITSSKMADGAVSSNKLADDINNSLKNMKDDAQTASTQAQALKPGALPLYNLIATDQHMYACHIQHLLSDVQQSPKPRPTYNRRGWLPY